MMLGTGLQIAEENKWNPCYPIAAKILILIVHSNLKISIIIFQHLDRNVLYRSVNLKYFKDNYKCIKISAKIAKIPKSIKRICIHLKLMTGKSYKNFEVMKVIKSLSIYVLKKKKKKYC